MHFDDHVDIEVEWDNSTRKTMTLSASLKTMTGVVHVNGDPMYPCKLMVSEDGRVRVLFSKQDSHNFYHKSSQPDGILLLNVMRIEEAVSTRYKMYTATIVEEEI